MRANKSTPSVTQAASSCSVCVVADQEHAKQLKGQLISHNLLKIGQVSVSCRGSCAACTSKLEGCRQLACWSQANRQVDKSVSKQDFQNEMEDASMRRGASSRLHCLTAYAWPCLSFRLLFSSKASARRSSTPLSPGNLQKQHVQLITVPLTRPHRCIFTGSSCLLQACCTPSGKQCASSTRQSVV